MANKVKLNDKISQVEMFKVEGCEDVFSCIEDAEEYLEDQEIVPKIEALMGVADIDPDDRTSWLCQEMIDWIMENRHELKELL